MTQNHTTGKDLEYENDLRPNPREGETRGAEPYATARAYDHKDLHRTLDSLRDDELKQIPVLESGARLESGATYFDLAHPERGEFTGMNDRRAGADECLVDKSRVDFEHWNNLLGETNAVRRGRFARKEAP